MVVAAGRIVEVLLLLVLLAVVVWLLDEVLVSPQSTRQKYLCRLAASQVRWKQPRPRNLKSDDLMHYISKRSYPAKVLRLKKEIRLRRVVGLGVANAVAKNGVHVIQRRYLDTVGSGTVK